MDSRIVLGMKHNKQYDINIDKELHNISLFVCKAMDGPENAVEATLGQQISWYFIREEMTRRKLAAALRSMAYKIQHYDAD